MYAGNIALVGLGPGQGTSFISVSLAGYLAQQGEHVSYTEIGRPAAKDSLLYDRYRMARRFPAGFRDVYAACRAGKRLRGRENRERIGSGLVNWRLITPLAATERIDLSEGERALLLGSATGQVNIFDFDSDDRYDPLLSEADLLLCVIDPAPARLIRGEKRLRDLQRLAGRFDSRSRRYAYPKASFLLTKMNGGINRKRTGKFLGEARTFALPFFPPDVTYGLEARGAYPWESELIRKETEKLFGDLFASGVW